MFFILPVLKHVEKISSSYRLSFLENLVEIWDKHFDNVSKKQTSTGKPSVFGALQWLDTLQNTSRGQVYIHVDNMSTLVLTFFVIMWFADVFIFEVKKFRGCC